LTSKRAILDVDYNRASTSGIPTEFGPLDFSKADNGGSVSGVLFTAEVSSKVFLFACAFRCAAGLIIKVQLWRAKKKEEWRTDEELLSRQMERKTYFER
jgi:hypothetical protein